MFVTLMIKNISMDVYLIFFLFLHAIPSLSYQPIVVVTNSSISTFYLIIIIITIVTIIIIIIIAIISGIVLCIINIRNIIFV